MGEAQMNEAPVAVAAPRLLDSTKNEANSTGRYNSAQAPGHFATKATTLVSNGYRVVPIAKGVKYPRGVPNWETREFGSAADLREFRDFGVGVLCGVGEHPIIGADIDITHPTIRPAIADWCRRNLGSAPERVGAAPRMLLVFRAAEAGWKKVSSVVFRDKNDPKDQKVEVLGVGQQFVAYHQHPDTGRDYEWVDLFGGLECAAAANLPMVTSGQIEALLDEVARLVHEAADVTMITAGNVRGPRAEAVDDLMSLTARTGMSFEELRRDHLPHVLNDDWSYDDWVNCGMALHHEYVDTEHEADALQAWREIGAQSTKDDPRQYGYKWRSFGKFSGAPTTLRWLLKHSNEARRANGTLYEDLGDHSDTGNANLLRQFAEGNMRFVVERGAWMFWNGTHWQIDDAGSHAQAMALRVGKFYLDKAADMAKRAQDPSLDAADRKKLIKVADAWTGWATKCRNKTSIGNMLGVASCDSRMVVRSADLDRDPWLFGVANGVVDLRTGALRPAAREDLVTKRSPFNFRPGAAAKRMRQFVDEITGAPVEGGSVGAFVKRPKLAAYIQRMCGYLMTAGTVEHKMFIAVGSGANGKNVLLDTVQEVMGDYCVTIPPEALMATRHDGDAERPTSVAATLAGARAAISSESKERQKLDVALVKRHTGGGFMTARLMRENSFRFAISHKLVLMTNHRPTMDHMDEAIRGRLHMLPFDRVWNRPGHPDRDPSLPDGDKGLMEALRAEGEGVLAWLVEGAVLYHRDGLEPPDEVTKATLDYFAKEDDLGRWLETMEPCEPKAGMRASDLFERYRSHCLRIGRAAAIATQTAFSKELKKRDVAHKEAASGVFYGLTRGGLEGYGGLF